jgi:hypothetical protein
MSALTLFIYIGIALAVACPLFIGIRLLILPSYVYEDYRTRAFHGSIFRHRRMPLAFRLLGLCLIGLASFIFWWLRVYI